MSSKPTIEPAAIKKRGRPKKVVAKDAGTAPEVVASKAAVKKAAAKTSTVEKVVEASKENKVVAKSGRATPPRTIITTATTAEGMKNAFMAKIALAQATPVTPSTSKILEEVEAKGTLKKAQQPEKVVADKEAATSEQARRRRALPRSQPPEPSPANPTLSTNPPLLSNTTPRTTTIPLPSHPTLAPSPVHPPSPPTNPTNPRPHTHNNPYPSIRPSSPYQKQYPTRIIEPTPDIRLPPKYKPAARRVTAIIVGLPIIFVVGYELFERWRGKDVRRKFVEDREVLRRRDREREREQGTGRG